MSSRTSTTPTILAVDDDELIISSLQALFSIEPGYELIALRDPQKALEEVKRRPIDVVISDFLMPHINGVDFLKHVRELQPEAVRILLTGFADKENAIRAINEVGLYYYLEKPWNNQDLLLIIRNALEEKSLRQQLREKVSTLDRLIRDHAELTDRHRLLERELEMAARVQRSLLPPGMPEIQGFRCAGRYLPCAAVGGDYYDAAQREDAVVILVSDVSGHGVHAALTSMLIKAIFHDAAAQAAGPEDLLAEMNVRLHRFLPMGMYASAAIVWIEPGNPTVRAANAGLPYPFVLRPSSSRIDQLPITGFPLGLFGAAVPEGYDCRETELQTGDVLLVATDGIGDIRGEDGRFFQDTVLGETLAALNGQEGQEVIARLLARAREFNGSDSSPDDLSRVAVTKI